MRLFILMACITLLCCQSYAQIDAVSNTVAIGLGATSPSSSTTYKFTYQGNSVGHYGLGWYSDSQHPNAPTGYVSGYGGLKFFTTGLMRFYINDNGDVGIGTFNPTEKLSVKGKIRAQEVKVETANWPDYVFEPEYRQIPLSELEQYIRTNKHLPEIPSARETEQEGISLGEMNTRLLKKIEELTLYVVEQHKQIQAQAQRISSLERQGTGHEGKQ